MTPTTLLLHGDCLEMLPTLPDSSVDSIVTDPPYGLSFMGKKWDYDVPSEDIWRECLRVLKPGGHLLAFAGTRTQHRMAVRIEDAGFEIRDMIAWVYGSGFPKSLNVANAIHDAAIGQPQGGAKPDSPNHGKFKGGCSEDNEAGRGFGAGPGQFMAQNGGKSERDLVEQARQWQGWGTALKPALEPITVARKPLSGTVAENVLAHGTGGLNVDGCRLEGVVPTTVQGQSARAGEVYGADQRDQRVFKPHSSGRWPANLIHDGSEEVVGLFPETTSGAIKAGQPAGRDMRAGSEDHNRAGGRPAQPRDVAGSTGSASRFFYCAKASKRDRDEGLEGFEAKATAFGNQAQAELKRGNLDHDDGKSGMNKVKMRQNTHPTVKPTDLMRYLCRLVTPVGGTVLDPFMGSGSTGKAAMKERFNFIGIERDESYLQIASARIEQAKLSLPLL